MLSSRILHPIVWYIQIGISRTLPVLSIMAMMETGSSSEMSISIYWTWCAATQKTAVHVIPNFLRLVTPMWWMLKFFSWENAPLCWLGTKTCKNATAHDVCLYIHNKPRTAKQNFIKIYRCSAIQGYYKAVIFNSPKSIIPWQTWHQQGGKATNSRTTTTLTNAIPIQDHSKDKNYQEIITQTDYSGCIN